ncbi:signal peptide peptidase SppA [Altericroceibacterium spongiae]|uniref:Signal peptide peptidase SppA n=1 Tax=Altericroceibacterium spongiae TaxID=2320269 RepID=A0A420EK58_9SPHN|nr:signal peptide peptidase SppA [Altericroceibacterium spongiae]RKF21058.1 signal peptide peptidase SppA [Altericroceibacterium spongiae]
MAFAGKVWRLLVGIKDALALLFLLLFFALLFAALSARPSPASVHDGALLLDLDGRVVEEPALIDPLNALLSSAAPVHEYAARDIVRAIDTAAGDDRIKAIALDLSKFTGGGQVHMQSIGAALDRFRQTKKPVLAYAVAYTDDSLMLAAHASEVWVDPMGGAVISGPGGQRLYYGALLDKLKIHARVYRVGTYKSAVEPYMRSDMSPAARENAQALYGALWEEWQANVKQARAKADIGMATGNIDQWLTASKGNLAQAALAAGLADRTGTKVEWGKRIAQVAGDDRWGKTPGSFAHTDLDTWLSANPVSTKGKPIGVITIAGEISDGEAGPGSAGGERISRLLDEALDKDLAGLVIRVDSPGGTVTGAEAIRRAILRQKARNIPIAVSMGNVAASGGYWVSTPADRIFAEPETITGSIGIFGVIPTFEDALAEWGVTTDGVRTTPLSGQPDLFAGFTPETETMIQSTIEDGYDRFLTLVAQSRGKTKAQIDEIAQGRVWDGGSARQLGLVDEFGDMHAALAWVAKQAKLKDGDWHPLYLKESIDPYTEILQQLLSRESEKASTGSTDMVGLFAGREERLTGQVMADLDNLLSVRGMQARCLECAAPEYAPPARTQSKPAGWQLLMTKILLD